MAAVTSRLPMAVSPTSDVAGWSNQCSVVTHSILNAIQYCEVAILITNACLTPRTSPKSVTQTTRQGTILAHPMSNRVVSDIG